MIVVLIDFSLIASNVQTRQVCSLRDCFKSVCDTCAPIKSQSIQPIDVIERWALCHHLGCVMKYLARVGCPNSTLEQARLEQNYLRQACLDDLQKAAWHLIQEINDEQARTPQIRASRRRGDILSFQDIHTNGRCTNDTRINGALDQDFPYTTEAISKNWRLSPRLKEVIFYIAAFQKLFYRFPLTRGICLKQALKHLRAEITAYEYLINLTGDDFRTGVALQPTEELKGER
jgi:hypothetical protein